jgi:hypothetical protein
MTENAANVETVENETVETDQLVSPYQAAKIVNILLEEDGVVDEMGAPKTIVPQMLYGYVRKGSIPTVQVEANGKIRNFIRMTDLATWYSQYKNGQVGRGGGVSATALAAQVKSLVE